MDFNSADFFVCDATDTHSEDGEFTFVICQKASNIFPTRMLRSLNSGALPLASAGQYRHENELIVPQHTHLISATAD